MADKKSKAYGLIMPKKAGESSKPVEKVPIVKKPSIFNDESSDEEGPSDWRKRSLQDVGQSKVKKQTKLEMSRALAEDPTVYQYDEVYDAMEAEKAEKTANAAEQKKNQEKKPRYIENLLKQAEIRNREKERRLERQVQKEREAEGDEFADKESFVTSAYRKKMEEMQKLEEEERKQDAIEEMLTVTKQKDMSGFYRHLYRQTMGEEKGQKEETVKVEPQPEPVEVKTEVEDADDDEKDRKRLEKVKARSYRKIQNEDSDHQDSDSQLESDSESSSEGDDEAEMLKQKEEEDRKRAEAERKRRDEMKVQKEKREKLKRKIKEGAESSDEDDSAENEQIENFKNEAKDAPAALKREKKIKDDVWKKVTVGEVFEAALQRYFARKASRSRFP